MSTSLAALLLDFINKESLIKDLPSVASVCGGMTIEDAREAAERYAAACVDVILDPNLPAGTPLAVLAGRKNLKTINVAIVEPAVLNLKRVTHIDNSSSSFI